MKLKFLKVTYINSLKKKRKWNITYMEMGTGTFENTPIFEWHFKFEGPFIILFTPKKIYILIKVLSKVWYSFKNYIDLSYIGQSKKCIFF